MKLIQQSCRLMLAAIIALSLYYFQWHEAYWIVIAALLGVQCCPPMLWRGRALMLLSVGAIAAALVFVSYFFANQVFSFTIFLIIITGVIVYLGVSYPEAWGLLFVTNLIVILAGGEDVTSAVNAERFFCILEGFAIAALLQVVFFPARLRASLQTSLCYCFTSLAQLNRTIFSCLTSRDYAAKHYTYEMQLHEKRADFLYAITKTKWLRKKTSNPVFPLIIDRIDRLYEIILSLGRLLHRVEDYSTFEVASVELNALSADIANCFQVLVDKLSQPNVSLDIDSVLTPLIFQLEEVNRSALQVVTREPIVFMFFINDLNELKEILTQLTEEIEKLVRSDNQ